MAGASPSERVYQDDKAPLSQLMDQIVFADHSQREGIMINHHSILRMRFKRMKRLG